MVPVLIWSEVVRKGGVVFRCKRFIEHAQQLEETFFEVGC